MPLFKKILYLVIGKEKTDSLSFRPYLLRKYHLLFQITAITYLLIVLTIIRRYIIQNRQSLAAYLPVLFRSKRHYEDDQVPKRA